jgi:hypothetical protein
MIPTTDDFRSSLPSTQKQEMLFAEAVDFGRFDGRRKEGVKRGGIRIIYYLLEKDEIYLLFAYPKNKQEDLTNEQLRVLRTLIREELS